VVEARLNIELTRGPGWLAEEYDRQTPCSADEEAGV